MEHIPTWLIGSLIFLTSAVIVVPVSKALGLGSIIGYLAAGILIGPWVLGLVTNVETILHFAEFGVVLMLFLVGLELEPDRLWKLRGPIFGWGGAQMAVCTAVIMGAALLLGISWRTALVAALGLALSSTAIALQVMRERNLLGTTSGQAAFGMLLFQDVAAIPILAVLPLLGADAAGGAPAEASHQLLEAAKIIGVIGGIIIGGRLLIRPALRWIARSDTPEIFTAASLLLVVAIAALMQVVGLSMALGAFLAGVLLSESEYRRELETDIEPFKGLLLGLFFIAVGMSIDFGVLMSRPWQILGIVLGFLVLKSLALLGLAGVMKLPSAERATFTVLMAQGGEFAFVVFQTAAGNRVFEPEVSSMLIGAVALSMLISPLLLVAVDRWITPRYLRCGQEATAEEISEPQDAPVIIAGFGRFGQIVARVLAAQGIRATILDLDVEMMESARTIGAQVFYGDATRLDLLRVAGAADAKVLVVAVDDVDQSMAIVDLAHEHFPQLEIVARARDARHLRQLAERNVVRADRELFESSLMSSRHVLEVLGYPAHEARQAAMTFRRHNLALLERLRPLFGTTDRDKVIATIKASRAELEQQMAAERADREARRQLGKRPFDEILADLGVQPHLPKADP
jgi:glutathione-regulated potassium-efflux system ancillary protein KefC